MSSSKPEIIIRTPQFERSPKEPGPASPPADAAAWDALQALDARALYELGLRQFGAFEEPGLDVNKALDQQRVYVTRREPVVHPTPGREMLWVLPGEWYSAIPEGRKFVDIFFREEVFALGKSDDDIRFGCLSFGIYGPRYDGTSDA